MDAVPDPAAHRAYFRGIGTVVPGQPGAVRIPGRIILRIAIQCLACSLDKLAHGGQRAIKNRCGGQEFPGRGRECGP